MRGMRRYILFGIVGLVCGGPSLRSEDAFEKTIAPILQRNCFACHGPNLQQANVRLDNLPTDFGSDRRAAETWHDALNALNRGVMPPPGAAPLAAADRTALTGWLTARLQEADRRRHSAADATVLRRLNRVEYQNTMRDLLGLDIDYTENLPPDETGPDGFKTNGAALRMSALQLETYLESARSGLRRAIVEGPAPPVFEHRAAETVVDKLKNVNWSNRLGRTGIFVARVPQFPDQGDFLLRVQARAEFPDGSPYPRMRVDLGYRADTQTPSRTVAEVDVAARASRTFEFRGRIEEFPLQSRTQSKYPGLLIWIRNVYSDGQPPPKGQEVEAEENGELKKRFVWPEDPAFPKVVIESISFRAPAYRQWPPETHARLVPVAPASEREELPVLRELLRRFLRRAYRRPAADADLRPLLEFFRQARPTVASFLEAVRETLAMALISPDFLYRVETAWDGGQALNAHELAARLAYFLWSTMPDERLMELADREALAAPEILSAEVSRMLADPRSWAFVEQFSDQWLDLAGIDRVAINPNYYPDFDLALKTHMRRETHHFVARVLRDDLSALSFLRSDFAMLNQPLAKHYRLEGPRGGEFEPVSLRDADRPGGLLTQASVLLSNSTGEDSHPVERGVWIRRAILNDPPAPPPPAVPNLADRGADSALEPLKRQLALHLDNEACASCHRGIDPWGIALEEFDAVGRRRAAILRRSGEREEWHPVDSAATLPDGRKVAGADDLVQYLLEHKEEQFARALTAKLLAYALGRSLGPADREVVAELAGRFAASGYRLRSLCTMIVASDAFRSR